MVYLLCKKNTYCCIFAFMYAGCRALAGLLWKSEHREVEVMNQFNTVFFGGYRKEQVDEYINSLIAQIEQMKERIQKMEEAEKKNANESVDAD